MWFTSQGVQGVHIYFPVVQDVHTSKARGIAGCPHTTQARVQGVHQG